MKLKKRTLNIFLVICLGIIISESMLSFYLVKDLELYNEFLKITKATEKEYITLEMLNYFSGIVLFIIFSVYNFIFYEKFRIGILYKGVWSLFIIGNILLKVFVHYHNNIFYFISLLLQIILLIYIILLNEREEKDG